MTQNILGNFQSPATAYEIVLTELSKSQHSRDEKILKVFEILDDFLPNLGVYYKIMRIVRQQLFDAVFSNDFTAARTSDSSSDPKIQRKSYYLLYKDIKDLKDGKLDTLKEELKAKDELLTRKEIMLNQFISLNENLKIEIAKSNKQIEELKNEVDLKKTDIFHMQRKFDSSEALYKQKIESLESNIEFLNDDLEQRMQEIKELSKYKNSFDEIHHKFSPSFAERSVKTAKKTIGLNRKNQVITDIMNAKKFEEQLHALINVSTEEYDDFMEKQQEYLLEKYKKNIHSENSSLSRFNDTKPFLTLFEKDMLTQQMDAERVNYQKSIADLKNQYQLIVQHRKALEEKLSLLEQDKDNAEFIKNQKKKATSAVNQTKKGSAVQGLEEHYEPIRSGADKDQYSVQDRIYSKFACTMHVSPDGKYWYDIELVTHCDNCGDKTLICPHKLSMEETVIKLPNNTSYLKFSRPKLRINQTLVKRVLDAYRKPDTEYQVGENAIVLTNYKTKYPEIEKDELNRESVNLLTQGNPDIGMPNDFRRVWKDYESKTEYKRLVQRPFTYERTLSIINQFLAYLHNLALDRDYIPKDIVNSLYDYMDTRYENEEIKYCAIFDFFTSIHLYAMKSRSLKEDDLENLTLDFISFSENKINKKLVWEFIMSLVIKKRDYIINEMEFRLKEKQSENENYMTEIEFCDVMNEFFFIADERQCQIAYKMSLAHAVWDGQQVVSIKKVAHIASYYCLIQIINDLKENINKMIEDSRKKALEHDAKFGAPINKNQTTDFEDEFIRLSDIDDLANSQNRFKNAEYLNEPQVHDNLLEEVAEENQVELAEQEKNKIEKNQ